MLVAMHVRLWGAAGYNNQCMTQTPQAPPCMGEGKGEVVSARDLG